MAMDTKAHKYGICCDFGGVWLFSLKLGRKRELYCTYCYDDLAPESAGWKSTGIHEQIGTGQG